MDLGPDVALLVGDEAAVPADVALLARPQPHAAPAHRALRAPGQQHRELGLGLMGTRAVNGPSRCFTVSGQDPH